MRIDIYSKYKVKVYSEWSYISTEDSEPGDIVFREDKHTKEYTMDGGRFLDFLGKKLLDNDTSEFLIKDNKITIETFNPNTGEGSTTKIEFERIEKSE